jgi:peptide/nickel transport system permease protein
VKSFPARTAGGCLLVLLGSAALVGPLVAPHAPSRQFTNFIHAPPMPPRLIGADGRLHTPFVYPLRLIDRLERQYAEDRTRPMPLRLFADGSILSVASSPDSPWFLLGTDALGRDVLSRLLIGARLSLGVACVAAAGALLLGMLAGSAAGLLGNRLDDLMMRLADLVIALPAIYVVLALRAAMPLVLSQRAVFWTMVGVFTLVGWPFAARGVRAIVARELTREYAEAARSIGAGRTRLLLHHLLPATRGFLVVQTTMMLPAFIVAEATLSFIGLGFGEPVPSWGVMLQEAGRGPIIAEAPWLLAPAGAMVMLVLAVNLVAGNRASVSIRATHLP